MGYSAEQLLDAIFADDVQPNHFRGLPLVEMTLHGGADVGPKFLERVARSEDRFADRPSGEAALGSLIHHEHDLDHGQNRKEPVGAAAPS